MFYITVLNGLWLAVPVFIIALIFCGIFPNRSLTVAVVLILIETGLALSFVLREMTKFGGTGLEVLILPAFTFAITLGNIAAVPAARRIRTFLGF